MNVCYWEAELFCRWRGKEFRLPSPKEWEKAASWDPATGENREYPWKGGWKEGRCNTRELGERKTTDVRRFPEGQSPWKCFDMAGNVWEWTEGKDAEREERTEVRGGSWDISSYCAACSYRDDHLHPLARGISFGFRCSRTSL